MVGGVLLARLLGEWGLMHQLTILRNVFLLGCPLLMPFASALFGRLHKGQKLISLSHFELEIMLQQSLADLPPHRPGDHALPPPDTLSGTTTVIGKAHKAAQVPYFCFPTGHTGVYSPRCTAL